MQNTNEFFRVYRGQTTNDQIAAVDSIESDHGIRSIWYDLIRDSVRLCLEDSGDILEIDHAGDIVDSIAG